MELIDKYIIAISRKLAFNKREDVKKELKSLLLDEIESKYGKNPTKNQIEEFVISFGSPRKVAKEYARNNFVIGTGFSELYFLIIKIVLFALSVAFVTVFVVELFTLNLSGTELLKEIAQIPLNILSSYFAAVGSITIIFILLTRFYKEDTIELDDDWTIKDLETIKLDDEKESKLEAVFAIFFLVIFMGLLNIFPELITLGEETFMISGFYLGHRINIEVFTIYLIFISIIWIMEIIYHITVLKFGVISFKLKIVRLITYIFTLIVFSFMINDKSLYSDYSNLLGFKIVFLIIFIVSIANVISDSIKLIFIKKRIG